MVEKVFPQPVAEMNGSSGAMAYGVFAHGMALCITGRTD
jgi:hypothetical protein